MASIKRNKIGYEGSSMIASRGRFGGRFKPRGPGRTRVARPRPMRESPVLQGETVQSIANQARKS
jgi:hypothetical protein